MKKPTLRQRLRYWIDRRMARGTASMVKMLVVTVLSVVLLVTVLVMIFGLHKEGKSAIAVFWDNLRSAMSSGFPSSDSGTILYIILYTLLGLTGMIFTGMLIGIFSSTMRGKLLALQKENTLILEKGHVVVLGFKPGEYALIQQLVEAAGKEKRTLVVADDMERMDMEALIRENVEIPKNVSLNLRRVDVTSSKSLECCAIPDARTVVIHGRDPGRVMKTLLALSVLLKDCAAPPEIVATVDSENASLPEESLEKRHVHMMYIGDLVARIVARVATQPGVYEAFMEMISFRGFEFYYEEVPEAVGLPFGKVHLAAANGIVLGIFRNGRSMIDPPPETIVEEGDLLIVFEEEQGSLHLMPETAPELPEKREAPPVPAIPVVTILGASPLLPLIVRELPDAVRKIRLAGLTAADKERYLPAADTASEIETDYGSLESEEALTEAVLGASHLIVLSDRRKKDEDSDTDVMRLILRLRELKARKGLRYTITAEMRCENNRRLIANESTDDFVVATDLSAMILAQVSEDIRRRGLFSELLDENGSETYLKRASLLGLTGIRMSARELRRKVYGKGYILIGLRNAEDDFKVLDDNTSVLLTRDDMLILIGEE